MLSFLHRSHADETITPVSSGSDIAGSTSAIVDAILQIERNQIPRLSGVPAEIAHALTSLSQAMGKRNLTDLRRAVAYSGGASEAVTNVARVVGDVNAIDHMAQAMSAAITELDTSMHNIASLGSISAESMATANSIMTQGALAVSSAGSSIDEIAGVTATMLTSVGALDDAAKQIGDIIGAIKSIASQTNLLALNATIEAARAGEAGKGFAVVAGEVKALSAQTSKATESIQQRISRLQSDVSELVSAMQATNTAVATGRTVTMDAKEKIGGLEHIFSENSLRMNEISNILGEQAEATRDLAKGVCKIADQVKSTKGHTNDGIKSVAATDKFVNDQLTELESCSIPNYVLHRAKSDHIAWKKRLNEMLAGLKTLSAGELIDHHVCSLGKWYAEVKDEAIRRHPSFARLEQPHRAVHDHGKRAAELFTKGDRDGAYREVVEMEKASEEVVRLLDALIEH